MSLFHKITLFMRIYTKKFVPLQCKNSNKDGKEENSIHQSRNISVRA